VQFLIDGEPKSEQLLGLISKPIDQAVPSIALDGDEWIALESQPRPILRNWGAAAGLGRHSNILRNDRKVLEERFERIS